MKKYYTPDFSEFHPGFEYESLGITNDNWESYVWDFNYKKEALKVILEFKGIRVKRLSRECIEAEGGFIDKNEMWNMGNGLYMTSIFHLENVYEITNGERYEQAQVYFLGTIRNKSELKRVLKQVMPQS